MLRKAVYLVVQFLAFVAVVNSYRAIERPPLDPAHRVNEVRSRHGPYLPSTAPGSSQGRRQTASAQYVQQKNGVCRAFWNGLTDADHGEPVGLRRDAPVRAVVDWSKDGDGHDRTRNFAHPS
jgi:hypothetical protein